MNAKATATNSRMRTLMQFPLKMIEEVQEISAPGMFEPIGVSYVCNVPKLFALVDYGESMATRRYFRVASIGHLVNAAELPNFVGMLSVAASMPPLFVFEVQPMPAE